MTSVERLIAALLVTALLLVSSFARSSPSGIALDKLAPGVARAQLVEAFGEPLHVDRVGGDKLWREEFALPAAGYARVTVWFDTEGKVICTRMLPVNALRIEAAELLFDLRGSVARSGGHSFAGTEAGRFQSHASEGVYFFLEGERVAEIWRALPGSTCGELGEALQVQSPPRELPEVAPSAATRSGELRELSVGSLKVDLVIGEDYLPSLRVTTRVVAGGMASEQVRFRAYLRGILPDLQSTAPLRAAPNVPASLLGLEGALQASSSDVVKFDSSVFETANLTIPLSQLAVFDGNFSGEFLVSFEAYCGGFVATNSAVVSVPGPRAEALESVPTLAMDSMQVEPGDMEGAGPGLWIRRDVTAVNVRGHHVASYAFLRTESGEAVRAAEGWDAWKMEGGEFFGLAGDEVLFDDSSWTGFQVFVPFEAMDLEPGEHRLTIRSQVSVVGLGGASEREFIVSIPEGSGL